MNLGEKLSELESKEKVCIITSKGIKCTDTVKKINNVMQYYLSYEIKEVKVSYQPKRFCKSLKKLTTIYI